MQVGAVNSLSFKSLDHTRDMDICHDESCNTPYCLQEDIDKYQKTSELVGKFVESEDMKGPFAAGASIVGAGATTFAHGAGIAATADKLSGDRFSGYFEKGLKKGSEFLQDTAGKLKKVESKKLGKAANLLGKGIEKAEGFARNAYKAISSTSKKVVEEVGENAADVIKKVKGHSAGKGMAIVAGILSVLALVPGLLKKDSNEDGVADIMQKSQNVYAKNSQNIDKLGEKASIAAELMQVLC